MQRGTQFAILFALGLFLLCSVSAAQEKPTCTLPDCDQAKVFFQKFQQAVNEDNRKAVSAMVRYPLNSYRDGKKTVIADRTQLLAKFDTVFDAQTRCALKAASVEDVWGNWRGFTISAGLIWWDRIIPNSSKNVPATDLTKYPFGVYGVNHGSFVADGCGTDGNAKHP